MMVWQAMAASWAVHGPHPGGVERSELGLTWSPLRMTSVTALGTVKARFTRA
jgi:hypothetical protein